MGGGWSLARSRPATSAYLRPAGLMSRASTRQAPHASLTPPPPETQGSGVLALPATVAQLGWVAGILLQLLFAYITWQTSILLADCHVVDGVRQHTYSDMVYTVMGKRGFVVLAIVQQVNLFLGALSYNITAGSNMQSFATSICAVHGTTDCFDTYWKMAIIFGAVQLIVVQLPDLNYFWWVSVGGFVTAVVYSGIGFGLSVAQTNTQGTVGGVDETPAQKGFGVLNGIGAILCTSRERPHEGGGTGRVRTRDAARPAASAARVSAIRAHPASRREGGDGRDRVRAQARGPRARLRGQARVPRARLRGLARGEGRASPRYPRDIVPLDHRALVGPPLVPSRIPRLPRAALPLATSELCHPLAPLLAPPPSLVRLRDRANGDSGLPQR